MFSRRGRGFGRARGRALALALTSCLPGAIAVGLPAKPALGSVRAGASPAAPAVRVAHPEAPQAAVSLPPSSSYVLVDVETGNVIAAYNEHVRLPPASLSKVLTALIAVRYLAPTARIPGTAQSVAAYPNDVGIEKGVGWPLDDVLQSLLVFSANDAAYALAQRLAGKLSAFGAVMRRSALQMGMADDPVFHDPAGLDGTEGVGGGNLVSARDIAIAGRALLSVPLLARIVRERGYDFVDPAGKPHDLPSMNYVFLESYIGSIGVKTGFTDRAGACIVAAASRGGRTMLAVVMNGYNTTQSAIDLLNLGFATPAKAEKDGDQLPAVTFPNPEAPPPGPAEGSANLHGKPAPAMAGHGTRALRRGQGPGAAANVGGREANSGSVHGRHVRPRTNGADAVLASSTRSAFSSVMRSWLARLLLLSAALAAGVALSELARAGRRGPRRQVAARAVDHPGRPAMLGRKRRQDIIDSYSRHEKPGRLPQPVAPPRHRG